MKYLAIAISLFLYGCNDGKDPYDVEDYSNSNSGIAYNVGIADISMHKDGDNFVYSLNIANKGYKCESGRAYIRVYPYTYPNRNIFTNTSVDVCSGDVASLTVPSSVEVLRVKGMFCGENTGCQDVYMEFE